MRVIYLLSLVLTLSACGNSNPVGSGVSSNDQATVAIVVDGRTGVPLTLANPPMLRRGETLEVSTPGFIRFRTTWQGAPVVLWPMDERLSLEYTRSLAYSQYPGHIMRFAPDITRIGVQPMGILAEGQYAQEIATAADLVSRAHDALDYSVGSGQVMIPISIDPNDPIFQSSSAAGVAYSTYDGRGVINPAKTHIVLRSGDIESYWHGWENFRTAVAHELGHTSGLMHIAPTEDSGIMGSDARLYAYRDFTDREKFTMHMIYQRRPGTALNGDQEDDTGVSGSSRASVTVAVVD